MQTINPNLYPRDGFYFVESDGSKIVGQTWTGVIARVRNYRRRAGLPAGNAEQEVIDQACARCPTLCRNDNGARAEQLKKTSLKTRVISWLQSLRELAQKQELDFSQEQDMKNRAYICSRCPMNAEVGSGCSSCKQALAESRKDLLGRRFRDNRLHGCLVTGEDMQVSAWLEQQSVENDQLPPHCWRKRTL